MERAAELRTGGQRLEMTGDGVEALHRLGVLERARAAGGVPPSNGAFVFGANGRPVPMPDVSDGEPPERTTLAIKRGVLGQILYEHARDDVEYVFDDSITGIEQAGDGSGSGTGVRDAPAPRVRRRGPGKAGARRVLFRFAGGRTTASSSRPRPPRPFGS
ncbi:2-polyprenyl-6-methoxyphenol hydroxylase-like FAD-dependent oxidoreductase [Lipingzhangella halophila]|uniref:2-polyprenyl-6-methoxyphenol hydroxylase-like FAD-dependent oxidoreductase n=1 Tax=Lipingzhangella halophila TaxID=1783352 RepID=A0A7W7RM70_9ACTN|nr:hypothetical protein [Lipingzhangella halophila]MBB4934565.1 2-polyprenyl-6-methoxyphenol hydroxylase-like FAD-dependent oxidoreductase [Lipingzhangella halophila]